ncbi:hypothetical protein ACFY1J_05190 [Streptomyces sp. NPDC001406]|uniref:hypothetical protein n=1 Tax=Streptomyces sp. NPDC001406 TaxID=3364572 RepID=UPI0036CE44EF
MAIRAFGETKTAAEWARDDRCVVQREVLRRRMYDGWDAEEAITTPSQRRAVRYSSKRDSPAADRAKPAQWVFVPEPPKPRKGRQEIAASGGEAAEAAALEEERRLAARTIAEAISPALRRRYRPNVEEQPLRRRRNMEQLAAVYTYVGPTGERRYVRLRTGRGHS